MTIEKTKNKIFNKILVVFCALCLIGLISWWVISRIKEHHCSRNEKIKEIKIILDKLHPDIKTTQFIQADKSYTINKDKIYLCLKDEKGEYYPLNMLIYVTIHEFAHKLNKEDVGHTVAFHETFDKLLADAAELGVYDPSIPPIDNYCMHGLPADC